MRLRLINGVLLAVALSAGCGLSGQVFAESGSASSSDPDLFLKSYYTAMGTAKGPKDLEPYMATVVLSKMKAPPTDMDLGPLFAEMIHSTHPPEVKIVSKKEEKDRIVYDLLPAILPQAVVDMSKEPTFKMTGSAILVKESGKWKIYKDYWVAEAKGKDGSQRMAFGTDPDGKDKPGDLGGNDAPPGESGSPDYSSTVRDYLMDKWKQSGTGKEIYVTMKVGEDGSLSEVAIGGVTEQQVAVDELKKLFDTSQPLPVLPAEMKDKPYAWMMFDWQNGGRCISGPYFEEKLPEWVAEKQKPVVK